MTPFYWLTTTQQRTLFVLLLPLLAAFIIGLSRQGAPLRTIAVPYGIGSLELAWTNERAQAIITSWQDKVDVARGQLHWDFGLLVVYPLVLSLACALTNARDTLGSGLGTVLSWGTLATGPLDAIENVALL